MTFKQQQRMEKNMVTIELAPSDYSRTTAVSSLIGRKHEDTGRKSKHDLTEELPIETAYEAFN